MNHKYKLIVCEERISFKNGSTENANKETSYNINDIV
jgi:hypothetical protein